MRFLVLGAGTVGYAVVFDLLRNEKTKQVLVVDSQQERLDLIKKNFKDDKVTALLADVTDCDELSYLMSGCDVVISCVTYKYNYELAKAAMEAGASFCDLGGNEDIVRKEFLLDAMAKERRVTIIPDCGLAPGLVSILAAAACEELSEFSEIRLRVGALPQEPRPPLNYSLVFSVEGLINEYVEDVTVVRDGKIKRVPALQDLEEIEFPAPFGSLEAFNTSGGISTLPTTLGDKVKHLDYKTIRYKGHCQLVRLLRDLGLMDTRPLRLGTQQVRPRAILATLLQQKLPKDEPDVVLARVSVIGVKDGQPTEIVYECIDYADEESGLSAVMRTTAFPISIIAQMIASGAIAAKGTVSQETSIPAKEFLSQLQDKGVTIKRSARMITAKV